MSEFDGVAVVTGGAGGIGEAIARAFGRAGGSVVVADVDEAGTRTVADAVERETPGSASAVGVDVTDEDDVAAMVEATLDRYGRLDAAVNNAGVAGAQAPTAEYPEAEFERVVDVNLTGVYRCLKHELRVMSDQGSGAVVNVASVFGQVGYQSAPAYVAAKHGVVGLTRTAAQEHASDGLRVNAVCPGFTETDMLEEVGVTESESVTEYVQGLHPMGRFGDPGEIAEAVVWLCSNAASYVTGTALPVDGGYLSR